MIYLVHNVYLDGFRHYAGIVEAPDEPAAWKLALPLARRQSRLQLTVWPHQRPFQRQQVLPPPRPARPALALSRAASHPRPWAASRPPAGGEP